VRWWCRRGYDAACARAGCAGWTNLTIIHCAELARGPKTSRAVAAARSWVTRGRRAVEGGRWLLQTAVATLAECLTTQSKGCGRLVEKRSAEEKVLRENTSTIEPTATKPCRSTRDATPGQYSEATEVDHLAIRTSIGLLVVWTPQFFYPKPVETADSLDRDFRAATRNPILRCGWVARRCRRGRTRLALAAFRRIDHARAKPSVRFASLVGRDSRRRESSTRPPRSVPIGVSSRTREQWA